MNKSHCAAAAINNAEQGKAESDLNVYKQREKGGRFFAKTNIYLQNAWRKSLKIMTPCFWTSRGRDANNRFAKYINVFMMVHPWRKYRCKTGLWTKRNFI